jgi:hypothetical protein
MITNPAKQPHDNHVANVRHIACKQTIRGMQHLANNQQIAVTVVPSNPCRSHNFTLRHNRIFRGQHAAPQRTKSTFNTHTVMHAYRTTATSGRPNLASLASHVASVWKRSVAKQLFVSSVVWTAFHGTNDTDAVLFSTTGITTVFGIGANAGTRVGTQRSAPNSPP